MALYKADVWLGGNSGRQTVSVSASTPRGAIEQICTIHHVRDTAIWNLREAPRERASGADSDDAEATLWGGAALVALLLVAWVVASFTPQVFGLAGVSASWWLLTRLQGKRMDDLIRPSSRQALIASLLTFGLTIAAGTSAALLGRQVQREHFSEVHPTAQPAAPEERPATPEQPSANPSAQEERHTGSEQQARSGPSAPVPPAPGDL